MTLNSPSRALHWIRAHPATFLLGLAALLFVIMQIRLLEYRVWNDEAETVLTANIMVAGSRLYTQIFNHHGPMTFFTGYLVALIGDGSIAENRIVIALLQWALIVTILRSVPMGPRTRLFLFLCMAVALTGPFRDVFAHMYKYQVLAGMCSAAALALFVLPRMQGRTPGYAASVAAGFCLGGLCWLAFTYGPAAIALGLAGFSRKTWRPLAIGIIAVSLLNLLFLALTGSFAGYIADHFYMNLVVLPPYLNGGIPGPVELLRQWFLGYDRLIGVLTAGLVLGAAWRLYRVDRASLFRIALMLLALASYGVRSREFHALPLYYSLLPLGLMFIAPIERLFDDHPRISWSMVAVLLVKLTGLAPHDMSEFQKRRINYETSFSVIVDAYTKPEDRVISYSFRNFDYLSAHRLPASTHFFYLPWQADYNRRPALGVKADPCVEIAAYRPRFIQLDRWLVFDQFPWARYGGCIDALVARDYKLLPGTFIYARNDISVAPALIRKAAALNR